MRERQSKLRTLEESVAMIEDGSRVAFGGFAVYQKPMALVHALIRAKKKNLTVVGVADSIDVDMLAGAGCLAAIETSYVGLEKFGLARNFRRAVEEGEVKISHYPELLSWDRFRADQEGLSFWPATFLGGSDIVKYNEEIKPFPDPMTGKTIYAVPAARPDYAMIHMQQGDIYGNLQIPAKHMNPASLSVTMSRAVKGVIATVDKLVDTSLIMEQPHLTAVPSFRTASVCEVPFGSHPTPLLRFTQTDQEHFRLYAEASASRETFKAYLDKYIYGVKDFSEYLDMVGREQLAALREEAVL